MGLVIDIVLGVDKPVVEAAFLMNLGTASDLKAHGRRLIEEQGHRRVRPQVRPSVILGQLQDPNRVKSSRPGLSEP